VGAILALGAIGGAIWVVAQGGGGDSAGGEGGVHETNGAIEHASFAQLSVANTNRCDLAAAELRTMPPSMHLRGACCSAMDRAQYRQQLRGLRRYRELRGVIPTDPYDVSVALARHLLTYRAIPLNRRERAAYRSAAKRSDTGGPCCCQCWRWQAFRGQARYLLHRRGFSAAALARVWDFEQGCGGPGESV
jgi:hypothetical protein